MRFRVVDADKIRRDGGENLFVIVAATATTILVQPCQANFFSEAGSNAVKAQRNDKSAHRLLSARYRFKISSERVHRQRSIPAFTLRNRIIGRTFFRRAKVQQDFPGRSGIAFAAILPDATVFKAV
jgi:hypothetical protein